MTESAPSPNFPLDYLVALDAYRDHPERTSKDALYEAEYDLRRSLDLPVDCLHKLYYGC